MSLEERLKELEGRVSKLEARVFRSAKLTKDADESEHSILSLKDLNIPRQILSALEQRIRKTGYWNLVLTLLYYAPHSLTHASLMNLTKELKKPVSYDWLDTEFHRKKYSGLVRAESTPGSKFRSYTLNEPGRRKAEAFVSTLKE